MLVYLVLTRGHDVPIDSDSLISGVWLTFTDALDSARRLRSHCDDEWSIKQHCVNAEQEGVTIWDSYTDEHRNTCAVYERYFPAGYPKKAGE